jgi:hypothetical protein
VSHEPAGLVALHLAGVLVFALSGGLAAVRTRLDVFGVVVVAIVTAIGGGILRDTLLGANPPTALRHWPYRAAQALVRASSAVGEGQAGACGAPTRVESQMPRPVVRGILSRRDGWEL